MGVCPDLPTNAAAFRRVENNSILERYSATAGPRFGYGKMVDVHKPKEEAMADSIEISNKDGSHETVRKERAETVDLSAYGETDIERLMYEALQDYAYHKRCASKLFKPIRGFAAHETPERTPREEHIAHHREKVEQARDRIRRYAKRLSPS
jgi:hypothetical protein